MGTAHSAAPDEGALATAAAAKPGYLSEADRQMFAGNLTTVIETALELRRRLQNPTSVKADEQLLRPLERITSAASTLKYRGLAICQGKTHPELQQLLDELARSDQEYAARIKADMEHGALLLGDHHVDPADVLERVRDLVARRRLMAAAQAEGRTEGVAVRDLKPGDQVVMYRTVVDILEPGPYHPAPEDEPLRGDWVRVPMLWDGDRCAPPDQAARLVPRITTMPTS
jgi:hypothetical protein